MRVHNQFYVKDPVTKNTPKITKINFLDANQDFDYKF